MSRTCATTGEAASTQVKQHEPGHVTALGHRPASRPATRSDRGDLHATFSATGMPFQPPGIGDLIPYHNGWKRPYCDG